MSCLLWRWQNLLARSASLFPPFPPRISCYSACTFTANGKPKFVPRDQVSPLLVVYCFLHLLKCRGLGCVSSLKSKIGLKIPIWILVKKRTLRFFDEDNHEYEIFSILSIAQAWTSIILAGKRDNCRHSTMGFSENDQRECRSGGNKLSNVRSFIILLSGEGLTSFIINNRTNFFGEKSTMKLSEVSVSLRTSAKTLSQLSLVLVLVLCSQAL